MNEFDLSKPYCYYFNELSKIPHGSKNEKALSDYLVAFAIKAQLRFIQDELGNVVIYKEASKGYENVKPMILQAHIDMVCEKSVGNNHNFEKDPLQLYVEDGLLRAKGTTLGADDGKGVAYMLALLTEDHALHPALECVFTVQEEIGLLGAMELKPHYFKATSMVSLDGGGEHLSMISTAGGMRAEITLPWLKSKNTEACYQIEVHGLLGGHSGGNIALERGNGNKLASRLVKQLMLKGFDIRCIACEGGDKDNAIPRDALISFSSSSKLKEMETVIQKVQSDILTELEFSDAGFYCLLKPIDFVDEALTLEDSKKCIDLLFLLPNGLRAKSMKLTYLPLASMNVASMHVMDKEIKIVVSLRSAIESWIDLMAQELACLASTFRAEIFYADRYPAWNYEEHSVLRSKLVQVYESIYHQPIELLAGHGGTECGVFKQLIPNLDIVTLGAISANVHTTEESLDLGSFDRTYVLLKTLLAALL